MVICSYLRKKIIVLYGLFFVIFIALLGRMIYLSTAKAKGYANSAKEVQLRQRPIKADRGKIYDRNGKIFADNMTVCTISVIHNQIEDPDKVIQVLSTELGLEKEWIEERVKKVTSIEKIKSNVSYEIGMKIKDFDLSGVKVDMDAKRIYPMNDLASKVIGFSGSDNQGIVGIEARYDDILRGQDGYIYTYADAKGLEIDNLPKERKEPIKGNDITLTLDMNIQEYCMQEAQKLYLQKEADSVSIIAMNPQNGEVLAMVDYPEFDLNHPFDVGEEGWRNACISDTYEPGSIFKIITAATAYENNLIDENETFYCPGYFVVEDRRIHCHKRTGHGSLTFYEGMKNSCNPVFINIGQRIGAKQFYEAFGQFELSQKTGIDLPGEAGLIMHKLENIGPVELATISFGQSFQVSPIRLLTTISEILNGGKSITPHINQDQEFEEESRTICRTETSQKLRDILTFVLSDKDGVSKEIDGIVIGGKTATSQTLPRSQNRYISAFMGFAPADDPQIILQVIIRNPQGLYYGGTIAQPTGIEIFENVLPYLLRNEGK